jgi:hypothetical protein
VGQRHAQSEVGHAPKFLLSIGFSSHLHAFFCIHCFSIASLVTLRLPHRTRELLFIDPATRVDPDPDNPDEPPPDPLCLRLAVPRIVAVAAVSIRMLYFDAPHPYAAPPIVIPAAVPAAIFEAYAEDAAAAAAAAVAVAVTEESGVPARYPVFSSPLLIGHPLQA